MLLRSIGLALLLALGLAGPTAGQTRDGMAPGAAPRAMQLDAAQRRLVEDAQRALEIVRRLKAAFVQVGPTGGTTTGTVYLRRPGRMRFEYDPPAPYTIVADGVWLVLVDRELEQVNRWPVYETPLGVLLANEIDFSKTVDVIDLRDGPKDLEIVVVDKQRPEEGLLTLVFDKPILRLGGWRVRDAQGGVTTVTLSNQDLDPELKPELFVATDSAVRDAMGR